MITQQEEAISVKQFVTELIKLAGITSEKSEGIEYGYRNRWLQEQDISGSDQPLLKKNCARIVHEFLRCEQNEPDGIDAGSAGKLQDLFDCRVCAGHVMQVYAKGIMDGYRNADDILIFGMNDPVSEAGAKEILQRVFFVEKRCPKIISENLQTAEKISFREAVAWMKKKKIILVDVRSEEEYKENHLIGAINCSMMEILKNPYCVSERRDIPVLLYCDKAYMSETAAQSLVRAGYETVLYFARNDQDE